MVLFLILAASGLLGPGTVILADTAPTAPAANVDLTLAELRERVLQRNETLQGRLLSFEAQRRRARGEYGIFEPDLYGSVTREINNRKNTAEQAASLLSAPTYHETNNNYEAGVEGLIPTGARVRLGSTLRDLHNTLQPAFGATNGEYESFFGLTVTQPLLRNFGTAATMAGIRLAAISNKMAFQAYRRDLMGVVSSAEATYWNLYLAQEQLRFFEQSVSNAQSILIDNRTRLSAGKGSELDVLEAQAGLGLRQAKLAEAHQKVVEAANRLISLYAQEALPSGISVRAVDLPRVKEEVPDFQSLRQTAFELNPDYLLALERLQQDLVRLGYARNQRLPELDLKGSYGLNGLGNTPSQSWQDIENQTEPSWYVGAEFHIPLAGGIKTRNELKATRLELESSEVAVRGLETDIFNTMNSSWSKLQSTRSTIASYQSAVTYNQSVFDSALTRLEAGKLDSRKVLELEADLLEAKISVAESLVHYELAALELEMVEGVLLQKRHIEISQGELQVATQHFDRSRQVGDSPYQEALTQVGVLRRDPGAASDSPAQELLRQQMRDRMKQDQMNREVRQGFEKQPSAAPSPVPGMLPDQPLFSAPPASTNTPSGATLEELRAKLREKEPVEPPPNPK